MVVSGAGSIGLAMLATLKYENIASRIIALDCSDSRLDIARKCGADITFNPLKDDVVSGVKVSTVEAMHKRLVGKYRWTLRASRHHLCADAEGTFWSVRRKFAGATAAMSTTRRAGPLPASPRES